MPALSLRRSGALLRWGAISALLVALGCKGESGEPSFFVAGGPGQNDGVDNEGSGGTAADGGTNPDASYALDGGVCVPGVPRCHGDFGYQMCEQDGTWGAPLSCAGYSANGTSSYCVMTVESTNNEPWAACVDPACWYWISNGFIPGPTPVGICTSSTTIEQCSAGGTLASEECAGVCVQVGTLDGRALGHCAPQCIDGAQECLGGAFYRQCAAGRWQNEVQSCAGGASCNPVGQGDVPAIQCGGACAPGTSRCASDRASIEMCSPEGTWEPGQQCMVGECKPAGPQAQCQAECSPGQFQCAFDGASVQRGCSENQLWENETACTEESTCRSSGGQGLGCVACVGPDAAAGNAYGVSDSRCSGDALQRCGADNLWQEAEACAEGEVCVELRQGVSGVAHCQPE